MAKLSFKKHKNFNITISSSFIEKYLPKADGTFVKVYLYTLMHSLMPQTTITIRDIAQALDIIESDVYKAWKYWEAQGIVKLNICAENELDIEFLDINSLDTPIIPSTAKVVNETKPNYTPKEIDICMKNNSEIKDLFKIAQQRLGKPLSPNDTCTLYSFYDWLKLPIEVIIMLLDYFCANDKRNLRYLEKIALDWSDQGIDSVEKAEAILEKIDQQNSMLSTIKKHMGIVDRTFTPAQMKYINKWIHEYKFDVEIIKLACDQAVINKGTNSINYIDSILEQWYKTNINSVVDAQKQIDNFKGKNKEKYFQQKTTTKTTNNKFLNFSQQKYDFNEIEQLMIEKRKKGFKESRSS